MHCFCWKFNLYCPCSRSCNFSDNQFIIPIDWREPRPATLGYLNLYCRIQFQVGGCDIYSGRVSVVDILRQNLDTVVNGTHLACCRRRLLLHRRHHPPSLCTLLPCWYRHCVGSMIDLVTNGVTRSWPITHTVLQLTRSQTSSSSSAASSSCRSFTRVYIFIAVMEKFFLVMVLYYVSCHLQWGRTVVIYLRGRTYFYRRY